MKHATAIPTTISPTVWASDTQLARYFSVSRATIWRWSKEGRLPKPKKLAPGTTRWRMADIQAMEG